MNHPTARPVPPLADTGDQMRDMYANTERRLARADLRALPPEQEVGASADRRRHDDRSRPPAAAGGAASSTHSAGARRGLIALTICFAAGWLIGRRHAT